VALKVVALVGGVGGAKLADGLARLLPPANLTVVVNTADDFEHLGLHISPDLDTVTYTLAGLAHPQRGWGRADESWNFLETLRTLGGPDWFQLGDKDLALHVERTRRLARGETLSQVTADLASRLGVKPRVLPMSDEPVRTVVLTEDGELPFQTYFVARRCEPRVRGFRFEGVERARPAPGVLEALREADWVVLGPSNPWVSLDPILAVPGLREEVRARAVCGVSPILGGRALKGPAAKMFAEFGMQPSALAVAGHYADLLQLFAIDNLDRSLAAEIEALGVQTLVMDIRIPDATARARVARSLLDSMAERMQGEGVV